MATDENDKQLRQYLLGKLTGTDEEEVELRLLTDASYSEDFDIVAVELIDDYVQGRIPNGEIKSFQNYFLKASVRQEELRFARALKKWKANG